MNAVRKTGARDACLPLCTESNAAPKLDKVRYYGMGQSTISRYIKSSNGKQKHQPRVFSSEMSVSIIAEITKDGDTS
eukprot:scaffold9984_cov148-Skeletonema_dohrnii-CCMP3373.AAC.5